MNRCQDCLVEASSTIDGGSWIAFAVIALVLYYVFGDKKS